MRALLAVATLALTPAPAHAGLNYKCESVRYEDQIGGWLRFDSAREGSVQLEYWNGYPPVTLVDADFASSETRKDGTIEITSQADRESGTVGRIRVPGNSLTQDKFLAKVELRAKPADAGHPGRKTNYFLSCVRH